MSSSPDKLDVDVVPNRVVHETVKHRWSKPHRIKGHSEQSKTAGNQIR